MKIIFCPNESKMSGVVSYASWENRDLQDAIRRAFNVSPREEIVEIEIDRAGIKAKFETVSSCVR